MPATPSSGPDSTSPDGTRGRWELHHYGLATACPPVNHVVHAQLVPCWESDVLLLFFGTADLDGAPLTFQLRSVAFQLFHN